ncbi:serine hydrolase domain-containing protein, partial [Sedimentibacter sp.]
TKRYLPAEEIPSLKDVLSIEAILEQEPGLSFAYSNTGFNLLELLIEEVTGRDFDEYMKQEILIPLGMYSSGFTWSEKFNPAVPFGYDLKGKFVPVYIYPEKGSGGLFSTIGDIAAFTVAGMFNLPQKQQELSLQSINMLYTPMVEKLGVYSNVFESYGLGYYIENLSDGNYAVSHGGQGAGWMTHFHSVPETGDSIVILTNSQRSWPFIAYLLSDWAEWSGLSEVGMSRIIYGVYLLWLLIWIIWTYLLLKLCRFVEELITKQRRFSPFSEDFLLLRIIQSGLSIALIAGLLWCIRQDYLFISSVFPIASVWLGVSILAFAITMLLLSFFPEAAKSLVS